MQNEQRYEKHTKILVGKRERERSFTRPSGNLGDHKKMYVKENSGGLVSSFLIWANGVI